jgi:hypothetical protein
MNVLALDLGSCTGYAYGALGTGLYPFEVNSKTWATDQELKNARARRLDRRGDIRVVRFFDWLCEFKDSNEIDAVIFEDVEFSNSRMQCQLWSSFRAAAWLAFPKVLIEAVSVKTLKSFAGHGSADKDRMLRFLQEQHPALAIRCGDDNAVDAAWLWLWAQHNLGRAKL